MLRFIDLEGAAKTARDTAMDAVGWPLHFKMFVQSHTGGLKGDGVLRTLPDSVLRTIKQRQNRVGGTSVGLYNTGDQEAELGLGTIGFYRDQQGNVLIKDKWKVDNPDDRTGSGNIRDLAEGGQLATQIHDASRALGTYREIPIEVRLSKDEWDAIQIDD